MRILSTIISCLLVVAFVWPTTPDAITSYYSVGHPGIDIATPYGREVVAAEGGTVDIAGWDVTGYGNRVDISNGTNRWLYGHLNTIEVGVGQEVTTGQRIGSVGCNGWCTGPHLHLEVRWQEQLVDPMMVLPSL